VLILDTDTLTVLADPRDSLYGRLRTRLDQPDAAGYATTAVSLQEQMRGRVADINRARNGEELLEAYAGLVRTFACLRALEVLPYTAAVQTRFETLRPQLRRLGTLDLRIACITLVNNATLLTRNVRDFRQVPGLAFEDWSR
jgi:tRNA(fMet)-specific endonuclease VapC